MAGNARADERDHLDEEPAPGGEAAATSPRAATAQPGPRADRSAVVHDGSDHASAQDDRELASAREGQDDASPHDIQHQPTEQAARHRTAPHEAQDGSDDAARAPELGRNPEVEESALPPHEPGSMDISVHEATYHPLHRHHHPRGDRHLPRARAAGAPQRLRSCGDVLCGLTPPFHRAHPDDQAREACGTIERAVEGRLRPGRAHGPTAKGRCASAASDVQSARPGFEGVPRAWRPLELSWAFAELPGLRTRVPCDADLRAGARRRGRRPLEAGRDRA